MICTAPLCAATAVCKGYCHKHYMRIRRNGTTEATRQYGVGHENRGYLLQSVDGVVKREHIRIAERALGRPLPPGAVVHHFNEDKSDNRPDNLLICPNRAYHNLIHQRTDALNACGHANWRRCPYCKQYDDPKNMKRYSGAQQPRHSHCQAAHSKFRRRRA